MIPVLARASLRDGSRHPWQVLLAALGIALGVAVVTAVDLTKTSASQSFANATDSVVGKTTHQIVGGPRGLDEGLYVRLRRAGLVRELAPVIEVTVRLPDQGDRSVQLIGVDPLVEAPLRGYWAALDEPAAGGARRLIAQPGTALVSQAATDGLGLQVGDALPIVSAGHRASLEVIGVLDAGGRSSALSATELVVVDIATAQETLGMLGRLSHIDLILHSQGQAEQVRALLGADAELIVSETRTEAVANMTRAFHTNLTALSLLALLVGLFLIYNSQTFLVVQRRRQFGILRALGVRRRQLAVVVLVEATAVGLLGTLAGLAVGALLAQALIGLVTQTINDLYYTLSVSRVTLDGVSLGKGVLLGLGGSVVAAALPAREAMRVPPRAAMSRFELERHAVAAVGLAIRAGLALLATGAALLVLPSKAIALGLMGLFSLIMGFALMSPALTVWLSRGLQASGMARHSLALRLALRGVIAALSRTGVAVAALMLAVSHTIGVGLMVGSFRGSVSDWLATLLRADYYISAPASASAGADTVLSTDLAAAIAAIPGVDMISHVRYAKVISPRGMDAIAVYRLNERARGGFRFRANPQPASFWPRFEEGDVVMVSEPYAFHHDLAPGERIRLRTDQGYREFLVAAIYQDYASDRGTIAMSRATYDRHWLDPGVNGIGVYTGPGFDMAALQQALVALVGADREVKVVANRTIREASLRVFDRTFRITEVLAWLAGLIAFISVFSALLAIQLERARELGILRAVGVTPRQIRRIVLGETLLIGGAAGLLAIPVGLVLGLLLVYVINRRSFGWTLTLELDPGVIFGGFLLALVAALLAGLYPAARLARVQPAEVLRQE